MLSNEVHEGLVLKSIDYKDQQKIITLFTPTRGMISLIVKGISRKKAHLLTLTSPLTQAEYHFAIGRTDLYTFQDGTPINTHLNLRSNLDHLQTATRFAEALLTTQFPGKPAPALYQLLLTYLKVLPNFTDPTALKGSFLLKLLKHDGHLALNQHCSHCDSPSTHYAMGECFCKSHSPSYAISLAPELFILTEARAIAELQALKMNPELMDRIEKMFKERN
ncbi:MAG: DNA repair protein RecO [Verrucomicrobia bacterium]|nr:DNA repair protein RecO [Verrucomicrobiota bacterium]